MQKDNIVKKSNLVMNSENMQKELFLKNISDRLEISEKQYKEGKVYSARKVIKDLKEKYGY